MRAANARRWTTRTCAALAASMIVACDSPAPAVDEGAPVIEPAPTIEPAPLEPEPAFARSAILIVVDGLREDSVGPTLTPSLDLLAREGRSVHSLSAGGWSVPSVAGLLTGVSPETLGITEGSGAQQHPGLPTAAWTIADSAHCAGLRTGMFAADGWLRERFGFGGGWDQQVNYIYEERSTHPDGIVDDAWEFIAGHRQERFFAYVHLVALSSRRWPPRASTLTMRERATIHAIYDDEVRDIDRAIERLIAHLRASTLDQSTLVVVTSDRGVGLGEGGAFGRWQDATPEQRHVPLIFWGAALPSRDVVSETDLVPAIDVAPTISEALGLDLPSDAQGQSLGTRGLHRREPQRIGYGPLGEVSRELCEQLCALAYGCEPSHCRRYRTAAEIAEARRERGPILERSCEAEAAYEREHPAEAR